MRVLLVQPSWNVSEIRSVESQKIAGAWPPPGLMYVGAVLRANGVPVEALDGFFYSEGHLLAEILRRRPDFLGIYTITPFWHKVKRLIQQVKTALPSTFVAVGGHYPSAVREQCLQEAPLLDAVVVNEGEYATLELIRELTKGSSPQSVRGTVIRRGGEIASNPLRDLIEPLDQLPIPAVDLFPWRRYRPSYGQVSRLPAFQVISSRGCSNNCLYCYKMYGRTIRMRTPRHVVDEIQYYVDRYGAREIKFWDESFTYDRDRVLGICQEIVQRGLRITWWVSARADMVDEELLRCMKGAGCWCINYGVESAVPKNLATIRKNLTIEQIAQAVRLTHAIGIKTYLTYIFGTPGETYEEGLKTIDFALKMNSFYAEFFPITPWPGTDLWADRSLGGLVRDLSEMTMLQDKVAYVPHSMTREEIEELLDRAYKRFYLRPRFIIHRVLSARSWYDLKTIYHGGRAMISMLAKKAARPLPRQEHYKPPTTSRAGPEVTN